MYPTVNTIHVANLLHLIKLLRLEYRFLLLFIVVFDKISLIHPCR